MSKKVFIAILALSLMQAPQAQAGFFSSFKLQLAAIGLALANLFTSKSAPRITSDEQTGVNTGSTENTVVNPLADDPNDYQMSTELVSQPSSVDCTPTTTAHRCSYLESDQVVSNSCVNPVVVKTGTTRSGTGATGN